MKEWSRPRLTPARRELLERLTREATPIVVKEIVLEYTKDEDV